MLTASDYRPPRLLRNPHLQSVLGSSSLRRRRGLRALAASGAITTEHILDGGNGARLQGWHSHRSPGNRRGAPCCSCTAGKAVPNRATCG